MILRNQDALVLVLALASVFSSCASIKRGALASVGKMFTAGGDAGNTFTRDNDPVLVEAALPTVLKMTELLRDGAPENPELNFGAGQIAVMYAGGFLQPKLELAPSFAQKKRLQARTKAMYLRGRDSILEGLHQRYKKQDFAAKFAAADLDAWLQLMEPRDLPFLYWGALAWLGAFALDPFDFELLTNIFRPILMLWRAVQLEPEYAKGSLHTSLVTVMGSLPSSQIAEAMSHSPSLLAPFFANYYDSRQIDWQDKKAVVQHHFEQSLALGGQDPSVYVAMANWLKANQKDPAGDKALFQEYLQRALAIDAAENPANQLLILIYQQQAEQLLAQVDEYFF